SPSRGACMPLRALVLVLAAAVMHTGWNFLVKRAEDKQVFTWWAMIVGSLVYLPLLALHMPIPARIWPYALSSAGVEAVYYSTLVRAYTDGDFSLVYPVARGAAPALLAVWAMLFLGERLQRAGIMGLALVLAGLLAVGSGHWRSQCQSASLHLSGL